ncbi:MAG: choice-of-anchor Q domain-containing protein, partial [Planctomycetota bacterium]
MRLFLIWFFFWIVAAAGLADTLHVPDNYSTIQSAIDAASSYDIVLVAPGTYVENIDYMGKTISVKSSDGPEVTCIDGSQVATTVVISQPSGPDTSLEGFYVTNGRSVYGGGVGLLNASPILCNNIFGYNEATKDGGGVYCDQDTSPVIKGNAFLYNRAGMSGGGIFGLSGSSPLVTDNYFEGNYAGWSGGGINCFQSIAPVIQGNHFTKCHAGKRGGGMRFTYCSGTVLDCLFVENTAAVGGGICCGNSAGSELMNNILIGNHALLSGGGIYCFKAETAIVNNTLYQNEADEHGGGICSDFDSLTTVSNTIMRENSAPLGPEIRIWSTTNPSTLTISYCDVDGGISSAYVDPGSDDLHLYFDSPCRDTGDSSAVSLPSEDFEGDVRIFGNAVDMGADEFAPHFYTTGDAVPGGSVAGKLVGMPATAPVGLWLGSGVLDPPQTSAFGLWYLMAPWIGPILLPPI